LPGNPEELAPTVSEPDALVMSGINKSFGKTAVLSNFSLSVPSGQRVAVIGGSGSGKTTILRLVAGLDRPDSGAIHVFGSQLPDRQLENRLIPSDPPGQCEPRQHVGMVFQQFNLFSHLTVLENVTEAPIHALKKPRAEARLQAMSLLDSVGLAEFANRYPHQLSGGQQQRVAIARALALRPRLLLLDEITASLDPERVMEVLTVVKSLASDRLITFVIVTHEMGFARAVADRVVFMQSGSIIEDSETQEFFSAPRDPRSRAFLQLVG
jgi:polar amino acid transport system ATP-binding protein